MTFDELREAYKEQARGLIDGGCDLLLLETIVDTLNAKAGIVAIEEVFEEKGVRLPLMISVDDHRSQRPDAVGPDDRRVLGVDRARPAVQRRHQLRARRARHAAVRRGARAASPTATSAAIRTPGCRTPSASTTSSRPTPPAACASSPTSGFVNIVGGCCGTTPDHIAAIAEAVEGLPPRAQFTDSEARNSESEFTQFAGLETLTIRPDSNFQMIGERTNVTGSARFARLIQAGDYAEAAQRRARAGARRREPPRRQHGRGHARLRAGDDRVPELHRHRARDRARADRGRQLEVVGDPRRAEVRAGQAGRQLDQPEGGRRGLPAEGRASSGATAPASS